MNLDALSRRFSYDPLTGEFHWLSGRHAGKPDDNRIANLRDVDARANAQNRRRVRSDSAIGFQCVERQGDRFRAIVCDGPVRHRSHTYSTAHEAHLAAMAMKRALHSAFEG